MFMPGAVTSIPVTQHCSAVILHRHIPLAARGGGGALADGGLRGRLWGRCLRLCCRHHTPGALALGVAGAHPEQVALPWSQALHLLTGQSKSGALNITPLPAIRVICSTRASDGHQCQKAARFATPHHPPVLCQVADERHEAQLGVRAELHRKRQTGVTSQVVAMPL
jgi:hypothetical protein